MPTSTLPAEMTLCRLLLQNGPGAFTPYWAGNITHGEVQEFQGTTYGLDFITKVLLHSSQSFRPSQERRWNLLCPAHDDALYLSLQGHTAKAMLCSNDGV